MRHVHLLLNQDANLTQWRLSSLALPSARTAWQGCMSCNGRSSVCNALWRSIFTREAMLSAGSSLKLCLEWKSLPWQYSAPEHTLYSNPLQAMHKQGRCRIPFDLNLKLPRKVLPVIAPIISGAWPIGIDSRDHTPERVAYLRGSSISITKTELMTREGSYPSVLVDGRSCLPCDGLYSPR